MALSYRAAPAFTNTGSTGVTSTSVTKQAGTASGDWILIYVFAGTASMACTGFTAKPDSSGFGGLLYRHADGSEGASFSITGLAGNRASTMIVTVAGATAALDPAAGGTPASGGPATSIGVPGITLANSGDWLLWFAANQNGYSGAGFAITPPSGFTSQGTNGALGSNATIMLADDETTSPGATGTQTGTFGGSAYFSGMMVALTPATPPPSTAVTAVLAPGTGTAQGPAGVASPSTVASTGLATGAGTAAAAAIISAGTTFPGTGSNPLGAKIELLLNSVWTDVTDQVRLRNPVQISGMGRPDWTSALQAATLTLTLNNRDGRFTPKNSSSTYFPYITRNVTIRVSVSTTSATGVAYSGSRFYGEVSDWPPRWDPSGRDVYCDITANGMWRRLSQATTTLGSAYARYNTITLTGSSQPRAYWPMEDGTGSPQLVPAGSVTGTGNATWTAGPDGAALSLAACTDFKGSDAIPQLNAAEITAAVPAGGTPTNNVTRFVLSVPAAGDSASGTVNWDLAEINSAGKVAKFEVLLMTTGHLRIYLRNSGGTVLATADTTTNVQGRPCLVSCELTPSGGNVAYALRLITPGAAGITESVTGTLSSASVGAVTSVRFSRGNTLMDTAVGHLSITYGAVPSMVAAAYALGGRAGEFALDRFTRICGEQGVAAETIGTASSSAAMGPQVDDTLQNVLQSVEDTDLGLLYESRTQLAVGYRTLASMANQSPAVVISYPARILDTSLAPAYDDQLTRNNVTVTNQSTGYTQQAVLTAGAMSVQPAPNGIGSGYAYSRTVNAAADTQTAGIANWLLGVGSVDEVRFPLITVDLIRTGAAALFAAIPALRPGDYLQITSPPAFLTASTIKQLTVGYSETIGPREWTFAYNAVPESPYETGFSPGTVQTAQLPGSGAVTSTAPGAGGLGGLIQNGSITPAMLNQGITVKTLGGNRNTIAASAPPNPDAGDIWINADTGLLSSWDGTAWQPYQLDASQVIQAGTVVASNIAASAITSGLIAAGTVVAGIVDATTITGAQLVATGAAGEILIYSGTPAAGNLVGAWSGSAGTDNFANAFAADISASNLTAFQPGSSPVALETWHTLGPIGNGWTTNHGRYRRTAENEIQLDISLTAGGSPTYGSITWPNTMPAAYRPIVVRRLAGVPCSSTASHSTINTNGTISSNIPSPAGTFDCCGRVPLD